MVKHGDLTTWQELLAKVKWNATASDPVPRAQGNRTTAKDAVARERNLAARLTTNDKERQVIKKWANYITSVSFPRRASIDCVASTAEAPLPGCLADVRSNRGGAALRPEYPERLRPESRAIHATERGGL